MTLTLQTIKQIILLITLIFNFFVPGCISTITPPTDTLIPDLEPPNVVIWENPTVTHFKQDYNTTFTMSWDDTRPSDYQLAPIDEKYGLSH